MDLFFLADFNVSRPGIGLLLWTLVIFLLFWGIVGKFAFKPIKDSLKKRSDDIQAALDEAKNAKEEMAKLNTDNQRLLSEAREERAKLLREAKLTGDKLISEARDKAKEEANKIVIDARQEIENQKNKAITEVKNQVGQMSIDIAEKLIRQQMNSPEQKTLVDKLVNEIKLS
ncbi:MAG: F0F1 ATP synthase subunit B [Saprospiraceae bacterium]|uniref:ATP synthase subunit b n=1 Tax=Candidatus Opimibacter skivensis TaxID=2982028 RepID=A0A9D7SX67_9BACT|nr:F0F1 ATP synthase subunit B [Candidatus Opimibacter skivensis]